jgi:hypothetical protein
MELELVSIGKVTKLEAKLLQLCVVECEMMMMMMMMMMMITKRKRIINTELLRLQDRGHYTGRCSPFPPESSC